MPGVTPPPAGPSPLLSDLQAALDALAGHGPLSGSRTDTAAPLDLAERARGMALRELAEMDAVGGHQRPGVQSTTASWLRDEQLLSDGAARNAVRLATALRDDLPGIGQLLTDGTITVEHAAAVVAGVRGLDRGVVAEAEEGLAALAQVTDPVDLRKRLRDKAAAIDDKLAADAERRARERMGLRLSDVGSHTAVDGTLAGTTAPRSGWRWTWPSRPPARPATSAARPPGRPTCSSTGPATTSPASTAPATAWPTTRTPCAPHLHLICRPDQLAAVNEADRPSLAQLLDLDRAGQPPAAPGIAGDLGPLSRGALRRLACDAIVDLVVLPDPTTAGQCSTGCTSTECTKTVPVRRHQTDPLHLGRSARIVSGRLFARWSCATGAAWSRAAAAARPSAPPTTSGTGPTAAAPTWTTWSSASTSPNARRERRRMARQRLAARVPQPAPFR